MSAAAPHVFLVAGEDSGDRLGAALISAIRQRAPATRFSAVGGAQMAAQGVPSLFPLGDLAIIGFVAIVKALPKIVQRIRQTADAVIDTKPDVLVIIDSPEFTHRVARRVRARAPDIPIIDYVCPSVWAWRPGRARAMRTYVDRVLALLPFEPEALARLGGPPSTYVGHPLSERASRLRPNADETQRRLAGPPVLLVMPGSRSGEIRRMAGILGAAAKLAAQRAGPVEVLVPTVPRQAETVRAAVKSWPMPARVVVEAEEKDAAFRVARAALVKSGTSTLELAVAGVPMVTGYLVPVVEEIIARMLLSVDSTILPNLILGENVVPQFYQRDFNPRQLADALTPLLDETPERRRQIEGFARLDTLMQIGTAIPSDRAAAAVLDCAASGKQSQRETVASAPPTA
jgi:lipid-A-disaccharide synthase